MTNIKLTNQATLQGYDGAFYRYATDNGAASACGIFDNWYEATGEDDNGTQYRIVWAITNQSAFDEGDEDCCTWDDPDEVLNIDTGRPITDYKIIW